MPRPCPGIKHSPENCPPLSKHHPALPGTPSFFFLRRSRLKYWSSFFPAETHPGKFQETLHTGRRKASHRRGQSPRVPIKLNITFTTCTKIQGVQGILKLPLILGTLSIARALLNDTAACCREKEEAVQLPCGNQDHEGWHQLEAESISSSMVSQNTGRVNISDLMFWLPMLMAPQTIKKQKPHPTEEIIRFLTKSNFLTRFLPLSLFILKIQSPFPNSIICTSDSMVLQRHIDTLLFVAHAAAICSTVLVQVPHYAKKGESSMQENCPFSPRTDHNSLPNDTQDSPTCWIKPKSAETRVAALLTHIHPYTHFTPQLHTPGRHNPAMGR